MSEAPRTDVRAWAITIGLSLVYLLLWVIPAPGIDHEALQQMMATQPGAASVLALGNYDFLPMVSLAGSGPGALVLVRGALALVPEKYELPARLIGFAIYLVLVGIGAVSMIVYLEGVVWPLPAVTEAGWAFRLTLAVTFLAGAALTWALASGISRWGVAHGSVVLCGLTFAFHALGKLLGVGPIANLGAGTGWLGWAIGSIAYACVPAIVMVALWRRSPAWPVRVVGRASLLSAVDAVLLPWIIGAVVTAPATWVLTLLPPSEPLLAIGEQLPHLETLLAIAAAIGLAVWLNGRGERRGNVGLLVGAPVSAAAAVAVALLSFTISGALVTSLQPGPFDGEIDAEVTLEAPEGARGPADAQTIVERLRQLGIDAEVRSASANRLTLAIEDVNSPTEVVRAVASRRRLELRIVAEDQGAVAPAMGVATPAGLEIADDYDGRRWAGPTPESLEPVLASLPPEVRAAVAIDCEERDSGDGTAGRRCSPYLLGPVELEGSAIEDAEVQIDPQMGQPMVMLQFDDDGARRFGAVTEANIRRKLAIVLDGEIESAPVIQQGIHGGRAQIMLGGMRDHRSMLAEANALAAALRSGELSADWRLTSERQR